MGLRPKPLLLGGRRSIWGSPEGSPGSPALPMARSLCLPPGDPDREKERERERERKKYFNDFPSPELIKEKKNLNMPLKGRLLLALS